MEMGRATRSVWLQWIGIRILGRKPNHYRIGLSKVMERYLLHVFFCVCGKQSWDELHQQIFLVVIVRNAALWLNS